MTLALNAIVEIGKEAYQDNLIQDIWINNANDLPRYMKGRAERYESGGELAVFPFDQAPAASVITTGEKGKFHGRETAENEAVTTGKYLNTKTKLVYQHAIVGTTIPGLMLSSKAPGADQRYMVDAWMRDLRNATKVFGNKWLLHTLLGAKGFLWKIADSGGVTLVSPGVYDIKIETDTAQADVREFMQQAWTGFGNLPIDLVNVANGQLTEAAGHGIIQSVINETTLRVAIDGAAAITPASYSNSQAIAWRRRERTIGANTLLEHYGLPDMISASLAFPYASGESGIDPAANGEWASIENVANSPGNGSVEDLDQLFDDLFNYSDINPDADECLILTTREFKTKLVQEKHAFMDYTPTDRNDMRQSGYAVFHNGAEIMCHRAVPKGVCYVWEPSVLAMTNVGGKEGPFWLETGLMSVGGAAAFAEISNDSPEAFSKLGHYHNNSIINRRRAGVITQLD